MPRFESISSSEDDDIWDYQSQTQKNKLGSQRPGSTVSTNNKNKSKPSCQVPKVKTEDGISWAARRLQNRKQTRKKMRIKLEVKAEATSNCKQDVDRSGRCPVCLMPFTILSMMETPSCHVDQCLFVAYSSKNECSAGIDCFNEIASHYKKFRHTQLFRSRRKHETSAFRNTGDVDGAKTKLFDISKHDQRLVPGSSVTGLHSRLVVPSNNADCVIELGASPLSGTSYSPWSNDDVIDVDSASEGDGVVGEPVSHEAVNHKPVNHECVPKPVPEAKINKLLGNKSARHSQCSQRIVSHKNVPRTLETSTKLSSKLGYKSNRSSQRMSTGDDKGGKMLNRLKMERKVVKNKNFLKHSHDNYEQESEEFVYEGNDEKTFDEEGCDLSEMLARDREDMDKSEEVISRVDTVDQLDDSSNSVQDINDILDESRSISEMINDVLESDDAPETKAETNACELNDHMTLNAIQDTDIRTADSDAGDALIDFFTNRPKKSSAILSLRNTPDKSPDSDSSSDWEILKSTLTQPAFGQKDLVKTYAFQTNEKIFSTEQKSVRTDFETMELKESGAKLYAESMKTPTKHKHKSAVLVQDIIKSKPGRVSEGKAVKGKSSQKGFFATKMLQNVEKKMSISDHVDSMFDWEDSEENDEADKLEPDISQDTRRRKTNTEKTSKANKSLSPFKLTQSKNNIETGRLNDVIDHADNVLKVTNYSSPLKCSKETDEKNSDTSTVIGFRFRSAKLLSSTPSKEEPEIVRKKPKIELTPKTTAKRKLGKTAQKQLMVNHDQKSIISFFEPNVKKSKDIPLQTDTTVTKPKALTIQTNTKVKKSKEITIQTDGESSDNEIVVSKRCCTNCTEGNQGFTDSPTILSKMHDKADVNETYSKLSREDEVKAVKSYGYLEYGVTPDGDNGHGFCSNQDYSISNSQTPFSCEGYELNHDSHTCSSTGQCQDCSVLEARQIACERHTDGIHQKNSQSNHHCEPPTFCQHSQGQPCLQHSQGQNCSQQGQGQPCLQHSQGQNCSQQGQGQPCLQHSQGFHQSRCQDCSRCAGHKRSCGSENHSLSNSKNTPQFNIENVCTLSQNTYTNMGGGFLHENDDHINDFVNYSHSAKLTTGTSCNYNARQNIEHGDVSCSSTDVDQGIEPILQIRRCATDILMASSRLLYSKTIKSNNAVPSNEHDEGNSSIKRSVTDVLIGKSTTEMLQRTSKGPVTVEQIIQRNPGWDRGRSSTNVEASEGSNSVKRKCPFYKKIPDTCFTVDAFNYGSIPECRAYILSHFHYDHYMGLKKQFNSTIYCTKITGNLVRKRIGVDPQYICTMPLNTPTVVQNVEITFFEANHCPGSVLILFKLKSGRVYLHTGDFRGCQSMEQYPELRNQRIHSLYLDTTYCDPLYDFPPQEDVIQFTVKLALDTLASNPKTLIVCGTYTIGKEKIFTAIAEALDCKICVTRDKKAVLDCLEDNNLRSRVSLQMENSGLHVLPMNKVNYKGLLEHLLLHAKRYNSVLGIEPTGWTHSKKILSLYHIKPKVNKDNVTIYGVPYSEHSSFLELKRFVQFTKPDRILPTVNNGNVHSRKKMEVIFEAWMEELRVGRTAGSRQSSITGWAI